MEGGESSNLSDITEKVRSHVHGDRVRITQHAHKEMSEDNFVLEDVYCAIEKGEIIEYYPEHRRGACCLISGEALTGRPLHVVCTTEREVLIIITVYEPKPPKWISSIERGKAQ